MSNKIRSYIYNQYWHMCYDINNNDYSRKKIILHVLRRLKATHLLESNVNIYYIRDFLGHESVQVGIGINEVNPAYRSIIGKLKYVSSKGITIHKAASYVIARRGIVYQERLPERIYGEINKPLLTRWGNYHQLFMRTKRSVIADIGETGLQIITII